LNSNRKQAYKQVSWSRHFFGLLWSGRQEKEGALSYGHWLLSSVLRSETKYFPTANRSTSLTVYRVSLG